MYQDLGSTKKHSNKNLLGLDPEINIFISSSDDPNEQPSQGTEEYFSNLDALYNKLCSRDMTYNMVLIVNNTVVEIT